MTQARLRIVAVEPPHCYMSLKYETNETYKPWRMFHQKAASWRLPEIPARWETRAGTTGQLSPGGVRGDHRLLSQDPSLQTQTGHPGSVTWTSLPSFVRQTRTKLLLCANPFWLGHGGRQKDKTQCLSSGSVQTDGDDLNAE